MTKFYTFLTLSAILATLSFTSGGNSDELLSEDSVMQGKLEHSVVLYSFVGKAMAHNPNDVDLLNRSQIDHIDLVYCGSSVMSSFVKTEMNKRKIDELMLLLPKIKYDKPTFKLVEDKSPRFRNARPQFLDYVVHYSEGLDHNELGEFFAPIQKRSTEEVLDAEKGGSFVYESGTKVTVPANAVTYADGTPVKGEFTIAYREFRDPAEIALSGLPMTYNSRGGTYNFSSVGMYEIRGYQEGKELSLQKPIEVDFNCTEQTEGVGFYQMNDNTGEWTLVHNVEFPEAGVVSDAVPENGMPAVQNMIAGEVNNLDGIQDLNINDLNNRNVNNNWNERGWDNEGWNEELVIDGDGIEQDGSMGSTLLAEGADQGHTYPDMVKGLNSPEFGVYNCDQIYRLKHARTVSPIYVNADGASIEDKHVACVLDLNYNGSFSFHPNALTLDTKGKNAILLFTSDERVFLMKPETFKGVEIAEDKVVTFPMTEVTGSIQSTDDLKKVLEI